MQNNYKKAIMLLFACLLANIAGAQDLLHYWNFNGTPFTTQTSFLVTGGSVTHVTGGTSEFTSGTGQDFGTLNAQNGEEAGAHLRFNNPVGGGIVFALPTTGYENPVVKFTTRRSNQGASIQQWSYSLDGTTYTAFQTVNPVAVLPELVTLNFSAIAGADNNANFKIKVTFEQGVGGLEGNNRFDNLTVTGTEISNPELIHYWNFNGTPFTAETSSLVAGGSVSHIAGGASEFVSGTGQDFGTLNAQSGEAAGAHIRFNNPVNGGVLFALPTTGYNQPVVKFVTRRSGSGAYIQKWAYSVDGTTFTDFQTVNVTEIPTLVTLDFSAIATASNNPNFKIRVNCEAGGGGVEGNNRFDNLTVFATPAENTADTTAPAVTIVPANNAANVAVNTPITLSFNEAIRLINDAAITNTNVDALVEVRLNNATGALVPFDATYANNTITIVPVTALVNAQAYYVRLLPNVIEDSSNNAVATAAAATFTTIALQTPLTAGDLIFAAYRMNATATEDEIALVTFVDISAGTFINLTDSKYTTNVPAQCANGIVWTATTCVPAGTVITIQTSALIANTGTVTGAGFGLSSGGDQVIVYTGTNTAPNYLTALTSNGWAATNIVCNGSVSMQPAGLTAANSSNLSTAPGNDAGNAVNAYYTGAMTGTPAVLKAALVNPANWVAVAGATAPQTWPAWAFPSSPTVQTATVVNNTTIQLVFNNPLNAASAANVANYTGVAGLTTAALSGSTVTLTYGTAFAAGSTNTLTVNGVTDVNGVAMACPYTFTFTYNTTIALATDFVVVNENAGTLNFVINLTNPGAGSVNLVVKPAPWSTATAGEDFTLPATQTLTFTGASALTQTIAIPVIDDTLAEEFSEYFVLSLENPVGVTISGETLATIYIKDNDIVAPVPNQDIELDYIGSFDPSGNANDSTCEIVVYDAASKRLFATSAVEGRLDIINFTNPEAPVTISSINMAPYGGVTSVAVKNGVVAVASPAPNEANNGSVVFFDTNGTFLKQVTVGALPDNISFTPDGTKVLTANEGQPNADYSVDPEGSVSIIDISGGIATLAQSNVNTLLFTAYNGATAEAALLAGGVRKLKATSTMSQDFEPEYIATSADSQKAWVTLQENNAIAEINLATGTIADVWALGTKDVSEPGNGFDISDNNNQVLIANWPIEAYYMPDGAATYNVGDINYIVTANEGDEKEYTGFVERTTIGAATYVLDAATYPQAAMLKKTYNAGRFRVTAFDGWNDANTAYNQMYALGARSFSIFNADTKEIVFDSGNDFEVYTAMEPSISALFNSDHEDNSLKSRSRAKGPEPEGVTVATIANKTFAFISLERIGGVMVYDITDPANAQFVDYKNSRSVSAYAGDHGPEGITYISQADSPDGTPYVVVANEISGTLTVFAVNIENLGTGEYTHQNAFVVFPNPAQDGIAYFNRMADVEVYDYTGKMVYSAKDALTIDTTKLATGIYLVKTADGITKKLIVK